MRILFYYCGHEYPDNELFLGTAHLYLKTFLDVNYPDIASKLHWEIPIQQKLSDEEFFNAYDECKPDIICTSHYIWNHSFLLDQLPRIKKYIDPKVKIIAGGPNIDCHLDKQFFKKYNFLDFAIYGSGEQAFADIIKSFITKIPLYAIQTVNVGWYNQKTKKQIVAPYKFQPELSISPYISNENLLQASVVKEKSKGYQVSLAYSLTRGCPYSCTFCDWNSGFSNKVSRRKTSYKHDIDLFQRLGIKEIFLADSNVGQYDEDVKMVQYFAKKNLEESANFHIRGNYSKLKKDNNLIIFKELALSNLIETSFNFSVQDTNDEILKNINRPDVGWSKHIEMINSLLTEFPSMHVTIQLIQGLPGQTLESWRKTLSNISKHKTLPMIFVSETLPASPAMLDSEYQKKFKFEYSESLRFNGIKFFNGKFAISCVSFTCEDFIKMSLLSIFYTAISLIKLFCYENKNINFDIEHLVDEFINSDYYTRLEQDLYENWTTNNKFYFRIDFDGSSRILPACIIIHTANAWICNKTFLKFVLNYTDKDYRLNTLKTIWDFIKSNKFKTMMRELS